jgi:hypothetical protein
VKPQIEKAVQAQVYSIKFHVKLSSFPAEVAGEDTKAQRRQELALSDGPCDIVAATRTFVIIFDQTNELVARIVQVVIHCTIA